MGDNYYETVYRIFQGTPVDWERLKRYAPDGNIIEAIKRGNEQKNYLDGIPIQEETTDDDYTKYFKNVCKALLNLQAAYKRCINKDKIFPSEDVNNAVTNVNDAYRILGLIRSGGKVPILTEVLKERDVDSSQSWNSPISAVDDYLRKLLNRVVKENKYDEYYVRYIFALTSSLFRAIVPETSFNERRESSIKALTIDEEKGYVWILFASRSNDSSWGMILPDPRSIFITFNGDFFEGIKNTNNLLGTRLSDGVDVFWRLESENSEILKKLYTSSKKWIIEGGSMGACFYTLIRTILS